MLVRERLKAGQAWTLERVVREAARRGGADERTASRVGKRIAALKLGVRMNEQAALDAARAKRARKAGRVLPLGHGGVPLPTGEEPIPGVCGPAFFLDEATYPVPDAAAET